MRKYVVMIRRVSFSERFPVTAGWLETLPIFDTQPGDREESRARVLADWEIRDIWKATKTEPVFGPFVGSSSPPGSVARTPPP